MVLLQESDIKELLRPENELEEKIITNARFVKGALWGYPRSGHPEGQVGFHIREVFNNIDTYATGIMREKLRIIALVHDITKCISN